MSTATPISRLETPNPIPDTPICWECIALDGLCVRCSKTVLPQLAINVGWLKLMGNAHTEQKRLQRVGKRIALAVSDQQEAWLARKQKARDLARERKRRQRARQKAEIVQVAA